VVGERLPTIGKEGVNRGLQRVNGLTNDVARVGDVFGFPCLCRYLCWSHGVGLQLATKSDKASALQDELTAATKAQSQSARETAKVQRQLDKLKAELERSKGAAHVAQEELEQRSQQLLVDQAQLRAELEETRTQAGVAEANLRDELSALTAERDALQQVQVQLAQSSSSSSAEQHAAEVAALRQQVSELESLKETAAASTSRVDSLTTQLVELTAARQQQLDVQALELQRTAACARCRGTCRASPIGFAVHRSARLASNSPCLACSLAARS